LWERRTFLRCQQSSCETPFGLSDPTRSWLNWIRNASRNGLLSRPLPPLAPLLTPLPRLLCGTLSRPVICCIQHSCIPNREQATGTSDRGEFSKVVIGSLCDKVVIKVNRRWRGTLGNRKSRVCPQGLGNWARGKLLAASRHSISAATHGCAAAERFTQLPRSHWIGPLI